MVEAPIAVLEQLVIDLPVYLDAGQVADANAIVEKLIAVELQPRNEVDLRLAEAEIALWSEDPDAARSAIEMAEVALAAFGYPTGRQGLAGTNEGAARRAARGLGNRT